MYNGTFTTQSHKLLVILICGLEIGEITHLTNDTFAYDNSLVFMVNPKNKKIVALRIHSQESQAEINLI